MFSLAEFYTQLAAGCGSGAITDTQGNRLTHNACLACFDTLARHSASISHGDRIILEVDNRIAAVAWIITLWHLGAVVVPVKSGMEKTSIQAIADDCNAKFLIADECVSLLDSWQQHPTSLALTTPSRVTGVDLALLIYTSGSTGRPKGIMLSHQNVLVSLQSICQYLRITSNDRILCVSPLSFDYGLYQVLFALYTGCSTVLYAQTFNPMAVIKTLTAEKISVLPLVPAMACAMSRLLPVLKPDLSALRGITNTGGHLPEPVIQAWKHYHPELSVYAMYGLTECKRALYLEPEYWQTKAGSVGKPIPGLDAKVVVEKDGQLIEAEVEQVGELYVRGTAVMQSYCDANAEGGARIVPGQYRDDNWLATGDLFSIDDDGFFYFKGRNKDLIKQAGFCLYPKDLESELETCPEIELCAVISSTDAVGDEIAIAIIQLAHNDSSTQNNAKDWINQHLDKDFTPRDIRFVDKLALTDNSKIDKKQLERDLLAN